MYCNAHIRLYRLYLIYMRPPPRLFSAFFVFAVCMAVGRLAAFGSLIAHFISSWISFEILRGYPRSQLTTPRCFLLCYFATLLLSWALHGRRKVARVEVGLSLHLLLVVPELEAAPRQDGLAQEEEARRRRLEHHRNAPDEHRRVCLDERVPRE